MINRRQFTILFILIILGFAFWYSTRFQDTFYKIVDFFKIYIENNKFESSIIFIVLGILSSMLSPFSSVPLVPPAIIYWGNFYTYILLLTAWFLGGAVTYGIGRFAGHPLLRCFIDFDKIEYYKKRFSKRSAFGLVVLFKASLPAEITGYALGILKYHFPKYLLATFIAEMPYAFIVVYLSNALITKKQIHYIIAAIIGVLIAIALIYFFKKHLKNKRGK